MKRALKFKAISCSIAISLLAAQPTFAVGPTVEVVSQGATLTSPGYSRTGRLLPPFFHGTVGLNAGYDDNRSTTAGGGGGAATTNLDATVSYSGKIGRTQITLLGGGGVVYFLTSETGRSSDVNAFTQLSVSYPVSLRLKLDGNISARYQTEPDFASDAGLNIRAGNFINLDSLFSVSYRWSLRISTSSTYGFRLIQYEDANSAGAFLNRVEQSFGQQLSFRWSLRTTVSTEYRLTNASYDEALRDSTTQFLLAGVDYRLSRRTTARVRGGVTLRSQDGSCQIDPNFEGSLQYSLGPRGSLFWNAGFSIEEANIEQASSRMTARTGLGLNYLLTWRLSADLSVNYHRDENSGTTFSTFLGTTDSSFSEDAFDVSLGLRYILTRRFTLVASVTHSEVISDQALRDYTRNRYSFGLNLAF